MTSEQHFILSYLPFWAVTYGFAVLAWTSVGRFVLQVMVAHDSRNYVWRGFRFLTDWWIAAIRFVTPVYILPFYMPLIAAFWAFLLRYVATLVMFTLGLAPRLSTMQGG